MQQEHPFLYGIFDKKTEKYNVDNVLKNCDMVFLHKHHGKFLSETAQLIDKSSKMNKNIKFIDLSGDFRLKDANLYKQWYKFEHTEPKLLDQAVYGLTELYRDKIKGATLIANPGCYPTAGILGIAPLLKYNLADSGQGIIIDAYSGFSGAGKLKNDYNSAMNVEQNIIPYKIGREHQHIPEMEQELSNIAGGQIGVTFSPHVIPCKYGILTTSYIKLKEPFEYEDVFWAYKKMYENEPFIRLLDGKYPFLRDVEGTNFCDIAIRIDKHNKMCIAMSVIDNVIKGASGQAIQNMNIMFGFDEVEGLPYADVLKKKAGRVGSPSLQSLAKNSRKIRTLPSIVDAIKIAG